MSKALYFIIAVSIIIVLLVAIAASASITFSIVSSRWQEYHNDAMQEQADKLDNLQGQFNDLDVEYKRLQARYDKLETDYDELDMECREEAGRAEVKRLETAWSLYFTTCMMFTDMQDFCLQTARSGYVEGAQDLNPVPGWSRIWHFIQFGEFLENG